MKHRIHLACLTALIALGSASIPGAAASVSGVVCSSAGVPQIGAVVQLLRPDLSVVASVYTNSTGHFVIASVVPGHYSLKAMGPSFLPSLRENVRVRLHSSAVVNLTLNTLYEVMQWLPAQPRTARDQEDDWVWTLRSAANRPLLRWLEDGPLVVVSEGPGKPPKLKARLMATGQAGSFGEDGERISTTVEETPSGSRELLARVDFSPETNAGMESMLGFRQDLGLSGSVQSVAAVAVHPAITAGAAQGLNEAAIRTTQTMHLGDTVQAEVGSTQVFARFATQSPNTAFTSLPFASVGWHGGNTTIRYRMSTLMPNPEAIDESEPEAWLPAISTRGGDLVVERGFHQEIGWERSTDASGISVQVYADNVKNPVVEAMGNFASASGDAGAPVASAVLFDNLSGLFHTAGPNYSSAGVQASVERQLPGGNRIRLSYANGEALVLAPQAQPASMNEVLAGLQPRHAQMYSLSLSGTIDGTRTHWRATYRWQPENTVTEVAPFALNADAPFLNLHFRQPIRLRRDNACGFEALVDVQNLLAQGYRPYLLSDGSLLLFAQDQRGFRGGLAFTF